MPSIEPLTISLTHLTKAYGLRKNHFIALDDISFSIEPGVFGVLGRNGAGKTTLLSICATMLDFTHGDVAVGPYDLRKNRWEIRHLLGYLPQEQGYYPNLSVVETLRYFATLSSVQSRNEAVERVLDAVNLTEKAASRVRTLSGGMRRRLGLAQALLNDPALLIIDEPTAGLDPVEQQRFRTLIGTLNAQRRRTIILSTHIADDITYLANDLVVMEKGRLLFQGAPKGLIEQAEGFAWEWQASLQEIEQARRAGDITIVSLIPVAGREQLVSARIIGAKPSHDAFARPPTLEDGYFFLLGPHLS